jgi:hypothetical protein
VEPEVVEQKPKKKRASSKAAIITAPSEALKAAERWAQETLEVVATFLVETQEDMDLAGGMLAEIVKKNKELTAELKSLTDPIRAEEKATRDLYKPSIQLLDSGEAALKNLMRTFELAKLKARDEALKQIAASGGTGTPEALTIAHGHGAVETAASVSASSVFKFRVTDESLIPEKYFVRVLNEKMIEQEIKLTGGKTTINGVEIYEDVQIRNKPTRAA